MKPSGLKVPEHGANTSGLTPALRTEASQNNQSLGQTDEFGTEIGPRPGPETETEAKDNTESSSLEAVENDANAIRNATGQTEAAQNNHSKDQSDVIETDAGLGTGTETETEAKAKDNTESPDMEVPEYGTNLNSFKTVVQTEAAPNSQSLDRPDVIGAETKTESEPELARPDSTVRRISVRPQLPRDRSNFSISSIESVSNQLPCIDAIKEVGCTKWVALKTVEYTDEKKIERKWDVATRTTKTLGVPDAVIIVPILQHQQNSSSIVDTVLVSQFRVPVQSHCLEFPAGLVDMKETPEDAALRELYEETGYTGNSATTYSSREISMTPGMCDETVKLVLVNVDLDDPKNLNPMTHCQEGEYVTVRRLPLRVGLRAMLENRTRKMPISLLYFFALGLEFGDASATNKELTYPSNDLTSIEETVGTDRIDRNIEWEASSLTTLQESKDVSKLPTKRPATEKKSSLSSLFSEASQNSIEGGEHLVTERKPVRPTLPRDKDSFKVNSSARSIKQDPVIEDTKFVAGTRWLALNTVEYVDELGIARKWDVATRTTKQPGVPDAVIIIPILRHKGEPLSKADTILAKQYRVPVQTRCIEFPAGLVDKGETPEDAALREFNEETGYIGERATAFSSRELCMTPGMCDETVLAVVIDVDLDDEKNRNPKQNCDEGEYVTVKRLPLFSGLRGLLEKTKTMPIAYLYFFALGIEVGSELNSTEGLKATFEEMIKTEEEGNR